MILNHRQGKQKENKLGKCSPGSPWLSPIGLICLRSAKPHRAPLSPTTYFSHPQVLVPWAPEINLNPEFQHIQARIRFEIPFIQLAKSIVWASERAWTRYSSSTHLKLLLAPYPITLFSWLRIPCQIQFQKLEISFRNSVFQLSSYNLSIRAPYPIASASQSIEFQIQKPEFSPKFHCSN